MNNDDIRCASCQGVYHPATGHAWTENCVLCWPCCLDHIEWMKRRMAAMRHVRRGQKTSFDQAALTSIIAK